VRPKVNFRLSHILRLKALESRQDVLENKISIVLVTVDANTETLSELKSIFAKFMCNIKESDGGNPSKSRSAVGHPSVAALPAVEDIPGLDPTSLDSQCVREEKELTLEKHVHAADDVDRASGRDTSEMEEAGATHEEEVFTESVDLVDSFLDFDNVGGIEARTDIVAAEALAEISSPKGELPAEMMSSPMIIAEGKGSAMSKESPPSEVPTGGIGNPSSKASPKTGGKKKEREAGVDPYALIPSPDKQQKITQQPKEVSCSCTL
jgi:hypothetical protein